MNRKIINLLRSEAMRLKTKSLLQKSSVWLLIAALLYGRPGTAHAQIDLGVIAAGLQAILSALKTSVGGPLQTIQAIEQIWIQYEQNTIYPQSSILQAQNTVASFALSMQQMNQIVSTNYTSAQLPAPQQLEQQLLSGDPNQVANLGAAYHQVYGDLPDATQAPQHVQNSIDITDAEAQDGFKKAIELDALAVLRGVERRNHLAPARFRYRVGNQRDAGVCVAGPAAADDIAGTTVTRRDHARGEGQRGSVPPPHGISDVVEQWSTFRNGLDG